MKKIKSFLQKIIKNIKSTRFFLMFYNIKVEGDKRTEVIVDTTPICKTTILDNTIFIEEIKNIDKVIKKTPKTISSKNTAKKKSPVIKETKKTTSKTKLNKK